MNTFQIVMIALAAALGLSVFVSPVWSFIKDNILTKKIIPLKDLGNRSDVEPSLVEIVNHWEVLKKACGDAELRDAEKELEAIFPLLVKRSKPNLIPPKGA